MQVAAIHHNRRRRGLPQGWWWAMAVPLLQIGLLTVTYVAVAVVNAALLRRLRIGGRNTIVLAFVIWGLASGLLAAGLWPLDSTVYANVYAVLLGDQVYTWAIRWLGDPHSAQAHTTIPWVLRAPQVYVAAGLLSGAVAGVCAQRLWSMLAARRRRAQ